ncbi:MAG: hypothetical protein GY898_04615 [Proteobacteria bacterium]|nr:hypothetical protein [Pseudomonadota bacterium]
MKLPWRGHKLRDTRILATVCGLFFGAPIWIGLAIWTFFNVIGPDNKARGLAWGGTESVMIVAGIAAMFGLPLSVWWRARKHENRTAAVTESFKGLGLPLRLEAGPASRRGRDVFAIEAESKKVPDRLALRRQGLIGFDIKTGDADFDSTFYIAGDEQRALAVLDSQARRLVLALLEDYRAEAPGGPRRARRADRSERAGAGGGGGRPACPSSGGPGPAWPRAGSGG